MNKRQKYIESKELQQQEKILLGIMDKDSSLFIFDIGACEGESSVRYHRLFPNATIYSFEPLPSNFDLVKKNIDEYNAQQHIFPFQCCLSDKQDELTFYVSSGKPEGSSDENWDYGNKSSSLLPPSRTIDIHPWLKFNQEIKVHSNTLEQFCMSNNIERIDFIHMDVQGAELLVLKGAGDFLRHINMVWLEVEAIELYKEQPLKEDVEDFMITNGFIKLEDTVYTVAGDQLWVKKDFILAKKGFFYIWNRSVFSSLKKVYKKMRRKLLS